MANVFPSFHFYPKKLVEETKRIVEQYKDAGEISDFLVGEKLPKMLDKIASLPNDDITLHEYAKNLLRVEVNILASEYPYTKVNSELIEKVITILSHAYDRIVGNRFWGHMQTLPEESNIHRMLKFSFLREDEHFLSLNPSIRQAYNRIFTKEGELLKHLAEGIGRYSKPLEIAFSDWRIREDSKLEKLLWFFVLEKYLSQKAFLARQNLDLLVERLGELPRDQYIQLILPYLEAFDFQDYHTEIMKQLIERLGDPRESKYSWTGVSETIISKVESWLHKNDLSEFFEGERFDYWKKYIRHLKALNIEKTKRMAAMEFDNFVVLEFGRTGNAAYFYEVEGFNTYVMPRFSTANVEGDLKDKDAHYYIHKLTHQKSQGNPIWYNRFDEYMEHFLKGDLKYRRSSGGRYYR